MSLDPPTEPQDGFVPLADDEKARLTSLLSSVSNRTLLQSLARLYGDNKDAGLIVAALLDRLPADEETSRG